MLDECLRNRMPSEISKQKSQLQFHLLTIASCKNQQVTSLAKNAMQLHCCRFRLLMMQLVK